MSQHSQPFLMIQVRNLQEKRHPKKHGIYTHFLKDRNSEVCKRTRMTRAPCRMRNGEEAVPRAEIFGDLTTADQKVVNEGSEPRDNDRHAVVVQDLATQWIQSYPCKKQKLPRKHKGGCKSSWSKIGSLKSRCAPEKHGICRKKVFELKTEAKATFYSLTEARVIQAPSSKKPEEK